MANCGGLYAIVYPNPGPALLTNSCLNPTRRQRVACDRTGYARATPDFLHPSCTPDLAGGRKSRLQLQAFAGGQG